MPQLYRGYPRSVSRFVLADGQTAALVPRERKHLSSLQNGYPLAEEFLDSLAADDVEVLVIDDGDEAHQFELSQYRRGNRVGHAPYPMKRVVPLDDATRPLADPATWNSTDESTGGMDEGSIGTEERPSALDGSRSETDETDEGTIGTDEWEWVSDSELQPAREGSDPVDGSRDSTIEDMQEGSVAH